MATDRLVVDVREGTLAVDRVNRGIVFMLDAAIGTLLRRWYDRDLDMVSIEGLEESSTGLPIYITVRGKRVYKVDVEWRPQPCVVGSWIRRPGRNWRRFWRGISSFFWGTGAGAA